MIQQLLENEDMISLFLMINLNTFLGLVLGSRSSGLLFGNSSHY